MFLILPHSRHSINSQLAVQVPGFFRAPVASRCGRPKSATRSSSACPAPGLRGRCRCRCRPRSSFRKRRSAFMCRSSDSWQSIPRSFRQFLSATASAPAAAVDHVEGFFRAQPRGQAGREALPSQRAIVRREFRSHFEKSPTNIISAAVRAPSATRKAPGRARGDAPDSATARCPSPRLPPTRARADGTPARTARAPPTGRPAGTHQRPRKRADGLWR